MKLIFTISVWLLFVLAASWPTNANRVAALPNSQGCDGACPTCHCHTHESPVCPMDLYAITDDRPGSRVVIDEESGLMAFKIPTVGELTPRFGVDIQHLTQYGSIMGSCNVILLEGSSAPSYSSPPPSYSCTMSINLTWGKLMLRGALPSYYKCLNYLAGIEQENSLASKTIPGCERREDGICCGTMAVTGGTGEFGRTTGEVRVCYVVNLCEVPAPPVCPLGLGLALEFDGLKGCEKCCTRAYYYDLVAPHDC